MINHAHGLTKSNFDTYVIQLTNLNLALNKISSSIYEFLPMMHYCEIDEFRKCYV